MPSKYLKPYAPTDGVRTDFKHLMNIFLSSATVRFEQFSEVWIAQNMSYLCAGRNTDREAREFVEKILAIAREYFLPPYQFQVRVGGLYLMYAIYQIQPLSPKTKIRLTSQEWDEALHFQQQAKQQSHLDVVYVFNKLIQEQAFQFCFTSQEMGRQSMAQENEDAEVDLADDMKEEKCFINKLFNYESLEQLSYLQDQYQRMKVALAGPHATKPDKSLNVVKEELVEDIVLSLQNFKENVAKMSKPAVHSSQKSKTDSKGKLQDVGSRRQALKNQAYSSSPSANLALDRANRAAQRALAKSGADDEQWSNDNLDIGDACYASSVTSSPRKKGKPGGTKDRVVISDDDTSEDSSDVEYIPASLKTKGKQACRRKVASRKNHQLKKSLDQNSPINSPKTEKVKSSRNGLNAKTHGSDAKLRDEDPAELPGANSGFKITWTPVMKSNEKEDTDEAIAQSGRKRSRGRPSKYLQGFYQKRAEMIEASLQEKQKNDDQLAQNTGDSEMSSEFMSKKKGVLQAFFNRQSGSEKTSPPKKQADDANSKQEIGGEDEPSNDAMPPNKKKKRNDKPTSSYEFYMAPASKNVFKNLGDNASSSKNIGMASNSSGRPESKRKIFFDATSVAPENEKLKNTDEGSAIAQFKTCRGRGSNNNLTPHDSSSETVPVKLKEKNTPGDSSESLPVNFKDVLRKKTQSCLQPEDNHAEKAGKGSESRQQNEPVLEENRSSKRRTRSSPSQGQSSYKIVMAPASSLGYADMGDNATSLPLQLPFKEARLSHTLKGKLSLKFKDADPKSSSLSTHSGSEKNKTMNVNSTSNSRSASSDNLNLECSISNTGSKTNCIPTQSMSPPIKEVTGVAAAERGILSTSQTDTVQSKSHTSTKKEKVRKARKSKYCTNPFVPKEEREQEPPRKTVIQPETLLKAFTPMGKPRKERPVAVGSETLEAMRLLREKLNKERNEQCPETEVKQQEVARVEKVVVQALRFL